MAEKINRKELAKEIATELQVTEKSVLQVLDAQERILAELLKRGYEVTLTGFGTYRKKQAAARKGRNPSTGESIDIPAKNYFKFYSSEGLDDLMND